MKYFLLLLLFISQYSYAECEQKSDLCAEVGEWNFSVSLGAGVYTNPLNGTNNTPLILIPKISYYGDKVFFENNTLGYTFFNNEHLVVSAVTQLNHEKAHFTPLHPERVFVETSNSVTDGQTGSPTVPPVDEGTVDSGGSKDDDEQNNVDGEDSKEDEEGNYSSPVNLDDIAKKRWAIDAGIQINWFINQDTNVEVQILHDINKVYNGFNGQAQLTRMLSFNALPNTRISYSVGANINSEALVDYFYGVPANSGNNTNEAYKGKLSIDPYFRFAFVHQFSTEWSARFNVKRIFLGDGIADSPLLRTDHIDTIFAGVTYAF